MRNQDKSTTFTLTGNYQDFSEAITQLGNLIAVLDGLTQADFDECPLMTANYAIAGAKTILKTSFDVLAEMCEVKQ